MKITKRSPLTGEDSTMELDITEEMISRWQNGELIQNVMPDLTGEEREFLISGNTAEDWNKMFPEEE
jgi:hypothetical protein